MFAKISEKTSLTVYVDMKRNWGREEYIGCCSRDERRGWAWWRLGIWKMKGCRREVRKGQCPMCGELEDGQHILLRCSETRNWRITLKCKKWLRVHEESAYKMIVSCFNRFLINDIGNYLFKVKGKWERHVSKSSSNSNSGGSSNGSSSRQQVTGLDGSSFT
jgi:hypothetical protein